MSWRQELEVAAAHEEDETLAVEVPDSPAAANVAALTERIPPIGAEDSSCDDAGADDVSQSSEAKQGQVCFS